MTKRQKQINKKSRKKTVTDIFDVARYVLNQQGPMSAMKLQKLVYYSQAWSLVWDDKPLFNKRIEAWANGPVSPELYQHHKGKFKLFASSFKRGDARHLSAEQKETVDAVLKHYGDKSAHWLSELTHMEKPWKEAREGLSLGERGKAVISLAAMNEYYSSLSG